MTIVHPASEHLKKPKYKCDICGKVDFWSDGWPGYGSINLEETCPWDIPTACSDKCGEEMMLKIKTNEFILPTLSSVSPYGCDVKTPRKGY
ncbi:MAG: hypothetical protein JKY93_02290 [Gammaproteobacteria bacterium]|nr:hypothetical protein [Gammaproteobacteria bacterium]